MKKKSNISLLKKSPTKSALKPKELLVKKAYQIEAQKKMLDFLAKLSFGMIMNISIILL